MGSRTKPVKAILTDYFGEQICNRIAISAHEIAITATNKADGDGTARNIADALSLEGYQAEAVAQPDEAGRWKHLVRYQNKETQEEINV